MTTDWLYPISLDSGNWGYEIDGKPVPIEDVLLGTYAPGDGTVVSGGVRRSWRLHQRFNDFQAGDRIWVRASKPIGAIVGLGQVLTVPESNSNDDGRYRFDVLFDKDITLELINRPLTVVGGPWQWVRKLKAEELEQITHRVPHLPELPRRSLERYSQVRARQGQGAFRDCLRMAYEDQCAITDTDVLDVLEAAHINPYDGPATNVVTNGILLRADLHTLFDVGLIWIDDHYRVHITDELTGTEYDELEGVRLALPRSRSDWPSLVGLANHRLEQSLTRIGDRRLLEPGRIVVLMPTARDGVCPRCGGTDTLRYLAWGMATREMADDPTSILMGCALPPDEEFAVYECTECGARYDRNGAVLESKHM